MNTEFRLSGAAPFPATRWSAVHAAASGNEAERSLGFERLVSVYWRPVYVYLRLKWKKDAEGAKDFTQQFFADVLERDAFASFDSAKARFRTFVRVCLDNFVKNELKAASREKRGGGATLQPLWFHDAEGELRELEIASDEDIEARFDREWVRSLFESAVIALRSECDAGGKPVHFALFERYDLQYDAAEKLTYETLAADHHLTVSTVTNHLAAMRRRFREIVLDRLREITSSDQEFIDEARELLGVDVR